MPSVTCLEAATAQTVDGVVGSHQQQPLPKAVELPKPFPASILRLWPHEPLL